MRRICMLAVAAVFSVTSLLAADLGKYKDWAASPAGYYLTSAERAQWTALQSEAEAGQFVQKYMADRGGETFTKELNKRIAMADTYLTVATTPGSQSTRGRIVILLGPPAGMSVAVKPARTPGRSGTAAMSMAASDGASGGNSAGDVADVSQRESMSASASGLSDYTFTYMAAALPTKKDALLVVEVNTRTGKDRIADKKASAELEKLLESAAQASIVAK